MDEILLIPDIVSESLYLAQQYVSAWQQPASGFVNNQKMYVLQYINTMEHCKQDKCI